jgi:hypothetical protein
MGRTDAWIKVKNPTAPAIRPEREIDRAAGGRPPLFIQYEPYSDALGGGGGRASSPSTTCSAVNEIVSQGLPARHVPPATESQCKA